MVVARTVVGKGIPRIDILDKVVGGALYAADITLPNMLWGKILRSPYPHALIKRIDVSIAQRLEGVMAILTHENAPQIRYNSAYAYERFQTSENIPLILDKPILGDKVRYVGDPVAAVAATTQKIVGEALELIEVEYERLPAVFEPEDAMELNAPRIHNVDRNIITNGKPIILKLGDIETGFKKADRVIKNRVRTSMQNPSSIEAHACVTNYEPSGVLTIWPSTQSPFLLRKLLSRIVGIKTGKIRIIQTYVGGGFGSKIDANDIDTLCCLLSKETLRPVKIQYTREEVLSCTSPRHPFTVDVEVGVKKNGKLTAIRAKAIGNTGAYASHTPLITATVGSTIMRAYNCPNVYFKGYAVYTNTVTCGAFRGYGGPQGAFAIETTMDKVARKLGIDPIELRLRNIFRSGDTDPGTGWKLRNYGMRKCIGEIAKRRRRNLKSSPSATGNRRYGAGVAIITWESGARPHATELSSATVSLNEDGTVNLTVGLPEIGTGILTSLAQITSEVLTVPIEDVNVNAEVDTDTCPFDMGSSSTRSLYVTGGAVKKATEALKSQIIKSASRILKVRQENVALKNGSILLKGVNKKISLSDLSARLRYAHSGATTLTATASHEPKGNSPPSAAHLAEVEVDLDAAKIRVLRYTAAHDVGKAINPMSVEGQIEGGIAQGLGYALTEELLIDKETGFVTNANFLDYKILTADDMPPIETIIVESAEESGPFGAKGVSEVGIIPVAAAIANAVYNAIGVQINEIPITPNRLYALL